jgi:hypothetical protein
MNNWACELNRELSEEEIQMASKHMKKSLGSLVIKDFISPQLEWLPLKAKTTNAGEDVVKQEPLYTLGGSAN